MLGCLELTTTSECGRGRGWAVLFQKLDLGVDHVLFIPRERVPPLFEFVREFDDPFHVRNIAYNAYSVNVMKCPVQWLILSSEQKAKSMLPFHNERRRQARCGHRGLDLGVSENLAACECGVITRQFEKAA